jgi:hypothetical protein
LVEEEKFFCENPDCPSNQVAEKPDKSKEPPKELTQAEIRQAILDQCDDDPLPRAVMYLADVILAVNISESAALELFKSTPFWQ